MANLPLDSSSGCPLTGMCFHPPFNKANVHQSPTFLSVWKLNRTWKTSLDHMPTEEETWARDRCICRLVYGAQSGGCFSKKRNIEESISFIASLLSGYWKGAKINDPASIWGMKRLNVVLHPVGRSDRHWVGSWVRGRVCLGLWIRQSLITVSEAEELAIQWDKCLRAPAVSTARVFGFLRWRASLLKFFPILEHRGVFVKNT